METKKLILNQIITFFIIISILTSIVFIAMFSDASSGDALGALMMLVPGISAIITSLIHKDKIKAYGWKLGKFKYLGYAFLFPVIIALLAYGFSWITGLTEFYPDEVVNYKWSRMIGFESPAPVAIGIFSKIILGSLMFSPFILGEEIGWSGFLTPKLLKLTNIPTTSLIVGVFWAVWHFPAIIEGSYGYGSPLWISLPSFTLLFIGLSFFRTYFVSKSQSLWIGLFVHLSQNLILVGIFNDLTVKSEYSAYFVSETGIITGVASILVAIVFWKIKKNK
jgi:membrane protease YdiL (CAAX protease family)